MLVYNLYTNENGTEWITASEAGEEIGIGGVWVGKDDDDFYS